jgi:hypothetical protein
MPVWNGLTIDERHVQPLSPDFGFNPAGESRLSAYYWTDWQNLLSADGSTPPAAQAALLGFAVLIADHLVGKFISYSPEFVAAGGMGGVPNPLVTGGFLPYSHPLMPDGAYLADGISRAVGDLPRGQTARGAPNYDEANLAVNFRVPQNGFRALTDTTVKTPLAAVNPGNPATPDVGPGDGSALANAGAPNEYYLARFCEVEENFASRAQSLPPAGPGGGGLVWADAPPDVGGRRPAASIASYLPLSHAEYVVTWGPVPIAAYNETAMQSLVMKTNRNPFPPTPPPGCPAPFMSQKPRGTLIFGQPTKKVVRMGDYNYAFVVKLRMHYHAAGANYFFRWDRPSGEGGPGFARVARADGSVLFPEADYATAFAAP